jgi:hypothetical protein
MFVIQMATNTDHVLHVAAKMIQRADMVESFSKNMLFRKVQYFSPLISSNLVMDMANNFLTYLSEIIQNAVSKKPEILRSNDRFTAEEILQFSKMSDVASYIADRKINELSYGGLRQMEQFIDDRLGLKLFEDDEERRLLSILVELRNIQTHNRGIVNDLFLNRLEKSRIKLDLTTSCCFQRTR